MDNGFIAPEDMAASLPNVDAAQIEEVIEDAHAWAYFYAPALKKEPVRSDPDKRAQVKAIMRRAIKHSMRTDDGSLTQQQTGPYMVSVDNRQHGSSGFYSQAQIDALRSIANPPTAITGAYSVDLAFPTSFPYYRD